MVPATTSLTITATHQQFLERAVVIYPQLHFNGLAANLTILDIFTRTAARIGASLETLAAVRARDRDEFRAGSRIRIPGLIADHRLESVDRVDLRICETFFRRAHVR